MAKTSKLATAFNVWYSNADMPELQNGVWVDLETGLPFMPVAKKAEIFDGQDLEGTALQQKAAGRIRNKMIAQLTAEQAEVIAKITVAKWFLNCKSVLITNIARYCDAYIAMTKAGNRKQLQWLADSVGLGFGKSTFHIDGKAELPADSTIARIEAIIAAKAIAEEEAAKQVTIVDSTSATSASITVGTKVFFSECYDEEYGSYKTSSAIVLSINSAVYDDGEVIEFSLSNSNGEYVGSGYAWENGARMFGNGDVYLTADAVPAVNCSKEEINWEEQG